jgi:hypothetical protein
MSKYTSFLQQSPLLIIPVIRLLNVLFMCKNTCFNIYSPVQKKGFHAECKIFLRVILTHLKDKEWEDIGKCVKDK